MINNTGTDIDSKTRLLFPAPPCTRCSKNSHIVICLLRCTLFQTRISLSRFKMGNVCDYPYSVKLIMCIIYTFMAYLTTLSVA